MILTEKETTLLKDLQTQEKVCVDKYNLYSSEAKDMELKNLFNKIAKDEQEHLSSITQVINGTVPTVTPGSANKAESYHPTASYDTSSNQGDKQHDQFLCTDCIGTEKMVSTEYNSDLFHFASGDVRKLLNHIQTEEQNHAEMIYKYKKQNGMA